MNALLKHNWGESAAADRVWSQVTGLAPSRAVSRLLMALNFQAFVDESEGRDEFVLGGHIATAEAWAKFAKEWEELLRLSGLDCFKMSKMALIEEHMELVPLFYKLIEENVIISISSRLCLVDFERALKRAESELYSAFKLVVNFKMWKKPYFVAFRMLVDQIHEKRETFKSKLPLDRKIDFILDDRGEKRAILEAWEEYLEKRDDNVRDFYGATPRFEDDHDFLPLQAADLWAWWVREWYEWENSSFPENMREFDFFGRWKGQKRAMIAISADEDQLVEMLKSVAVEDLADDNVPKRRLTFPS
jgi:hypothetical protein